MLCVNSPDYEIIRPPSDSPFASAEVVLHTSIFVMAVFLRLAMALILLAMPSTGDTSLVGAWSRLRNDFSTPRNTTEVQGELPVAASKQTREMT